MDPQTVLELERIAALKAQLDEASREVDIAEYNCDPIPNYRLSSSPQYAALTQAVERRNVAEEKYVYACAHVFSDVLAELARLTADLAQAREHMTAPELGRKGGASKSEAKRAASASNGKKGGRPRKVTPAE